MDEAVEDVAEMVEGLDIKDPFKTNEKESFPRKDYTPHATHVDCRDKRRPRCPGSSSSSDNDNE